MAKIRLSRIKISAFKISSYAGPSVYFEMGQELNSRPTDKKPKSDGNFKAILVDVCDSPTDSGIGRIVLSQSPSYRLFWIVFYLFAVCALLVNLGLILVSFYEYKTVQVSRTVQEIPDFRDVTFCSSNPFSTVVSDSYEGALILQRILPFHDFRDKLSKERNLTEVVRSLYLVSTHYANVGSGLASHSGHKQKDLLVNCLFRGQCVQAS